MKLYHYTSVESFEKIWDSKSLKFSQCKTTNDSFERNKSLRLSWDSFPDTKDKEIINDFFLSLFNEIEEYHQISLTKDYDNLKGFASPMMWGQYARTKLPNGIWQDGVCIELDSSKIRRPEFHYYEGEIEYKELVPMPCIFGINPKDPQAADKYVSMNKDLLFFTKHIHWNNENEYRIVCKGKEYLDISEAITGIYVIGNESPAFNKVSDLVEDESLINFLSLGGFDGLCLVPTNLKHFNDFHRSISSRGINPDKYKR